MSEYIVDVQFASDFDADNMRHFELDVRSTKEVVRCKNCQNATPDGRFCYEFGEYDDPANVDPDGFCAWATKRGEI